MADGPGSSVFEFEFPAKMPKCFNMTPKSLGITSLECLKFKSKEEGNNMNSDFIKV